VAAAASRPAGPVAAAAASLSARHPRPAFQSPCVPPRSDLERRLAGLWQDLLGIDQIGIHDDFFELGGDSLRGVQLAALARQAGLSLTAAELFERPTVAALAASLTDGPPDPGEAQEPEIQPETPRLTGVSLSPEELDELVAAFGEDEMSKPSNIEDIYPLSPLQQGMLFHSVYAPQSGVYVEQLVYSFEGRGAVDVSLLRQAFQALLRAVQRGVQVLQPLPDSGRSDRVDL